MKEQKNKRRFIRIGVALALIALMCLGYGITAKYTKQKTIAATLTVNSTLVTEIKAAAHVAEKQPDGTYAIGAETAASNACGILPGTDVPMDPHVILTGKTSVPSYIYVEVCDDTASGITFVIADTWVEVAGATGPHGGRVFCYQAVIDENSPDELPVFEGDKVYVSENIGSEEASSFIIYPYIAEAGDKTPAEAFDPNSCGSAYSASFTPYPKGSAQVMTPDPESEEINRIYVKANDNEYAVYTRAVLTVNWQNAEGDLLADAPAEGVDYTVEYGNEWVKGSDGFYYWPRPLAGGARTGDLVVSFTRTEEAPEGYECAVSVSVQTIQAPGATDDGIPVVASAWGCTVDGEGRISK